MQELLTATIIATPIAFFAFAIAREFCRHNCQRPATAIATAALIATSTPAPFPSVAPPPLPELPAAVEPATIEPTRPDFATMKATELRKLCQAQGMKGAARAKKAAAIQWLEGNWTPF